MKRALALVVAMGPNGVIGKAGGLPWHLPEDLRHFKNVTMGHVMIMGRKTWDSIGKALPGRQSFVVSRSPNLKLVGAEVFSSLELALHAAYAHDTEPRVIGGGELYKAALPLATRLFVTEVSMPVEGDTYFPALDSTQFVATERRQGSTAHVQFVTLERVEQMR